jgi:hypothetical protein
MDVEVVATGDVICKVSWWMCQGGCCRVEQRGLNRRLLEQNLRLRWR